MSVAPTPPRCRDSRARAAWGRAARIVAVLDTPPAPHRRQCRKGHAVGQAKSIALSIVKSEKEVHEAPRAAARRQSVEVRIVRPEAISDVEPEHERRPESNRPWLKSFTRPAVRL